MKSFITTLCLFFTTLQITFANEYYALEEGIICPDSVIVQDINQAPAYTTFQEYLDAGGSYSITNPIDSTFKLISETSDGNFCPGHKYREYSIQDDQGIEYSCTQVIKVTGYDVDLTTNFTVDSLTVNAMSNSSDGTIGYEWDFGDGFLANEANVTHTYEMPGIYTICCSATTICDFQNVCAKVKVGIEDFDMADISIYYHCDEEIDYNFTFDQYLQFGGSTTSIADTASFAYLAVGDTMTISTDQGCTYQVPIQYTMMDQYEQVDTAVITLNLLDTVGIVAIDLNDEIPCDADTLTSFNSLEDYINAGGSYSVNCFNETPTISMISETVVNENCPKKIERVYELIACSRDTIIHTIEYIDTIPPVIEIDDITVQYKEDLPLLPNNLEDFIALGGKASDNCELNAESFIVQEKELAGEPFIISRDYFIEDLCGGKSSIKQIITVTDPTSTDEEEFSPDFTLYPNPGKDFVTIEIENNEKFDITIYRIDGQLIYSNQAQNNGLRIETKNWIEGIYIVQLKTKSKRVTQKWIKEIN